MTLERIAAAAVAAGTFAGAAVHGDSVTLIPIKDNTLIQSKFDLSNGIGDSFYCGRTGDFGEGTLRRAVLAFDVAASVPAGSSIVNVALTLTVLQGSSPGTENHRLHRLLADWGEGQSIAGGGSGAPAEPGDATWVYRFYPDFSWASAGGDFLAGSSAAQNVPNFVSPVTWSSATMVQDVQGWLDDPATDFGWMLRGNEAEMMTARRFASKDNENPSMRPMLVIEFTPPCAGDTDGSGVVDVSDLVNVILDWGCTGGAGSGACVGDVTGDGQVNVEDLVDVIVNWGPC